MTALQGNLILRPMTMDDLKQVYQIEVDSFTLPWSYNSYVFELRESRVSRCFVAASQEDDSQQKILGMIVIYLIEDEAHVATFAVHPAYRQSGIGWRLLLHALKESCRQGATHSFLEVRAGNLPAINLYTRFGYASVGRRKNYYVDNHEDAILMNLDNLSQEKLSQIEAQFLASPLKQPSGGSHDA